MKFGESLKEVITDIVSFISLVLNWGLNYAKNENDETRNYI